MTEHPQIYEVVVSTGSAPKLPGLWKRVPCGSGFFSPNPNRGQLLADLTSRFQREALMASGVVVADAHDNISLHPGLADEHAIIFAARPAESLPPFDLVVEGATVQKRQPLVQMVSDYRIANGLRENGGQLLAAFSLRDASVLWSIGFPTAVASGLDCLRRSALDAVCKALHLRRGPLAEGEPAVEPQSGREGAPISLTLVGWDVASLGPSDSKTVAAVRDHLSGLCKHMGCEFDDLVVWKPASAEVERISFCLVNGHLNEVGAAMNDSIDESFRQQARDDRKRAAITKSYDSAVADWLELQDVQGIDTQRKKLAWQQVQEAHEAELIQPLMQKSRQTTDPAKRNRLTMIAETRRVFSPLSISLAADFAKNARERGAGGAFELPKEAVQQFLAVTDRLDKLSREA